MHPILAHPPQPQPQPHGTTSLPPPLHPVPTALACASPVPSTAATTWVEQRWYAHRALDSLLIMELEVLFEAVPGGPPFDASVPVVVGLATNSGPPSSDIDFTGFPTPSSYIIMNGSTLVPESNSSSLTGGRVESVVLVMSCLLSPSGWNLWLARSHHPTPPHPTHLPPYQISRWYSHTQYPHASSF